jgi:lysophospholipase L1-like esterase
MKFRDDPRRFQSTVLAVPGYSSYQGRILTELFGSEMEPDVAVVFFGWNDHWLAYGVVDAQKAVRTSARRFDGLVRWTYHHFRLVQAANWLAASIAGSQNEPTDTTRVPIDAYRDNLSRIGTFFNESGVPVIFISAPTSHYKLGVPSYLMEEKFVRSAEEAVRLHREYNEVVRETARDGGSYLLDLESEFELLRAEDLERLFTNDGIHLSQSGLAVVAKRVYETISERVLQER